MWQKIRATSLYSVGSKDPDHEAVIRFCGKAPRRRVHSPSGVAAIAVIGLPPPRIVIGYPVHQRSQVPNPVCPFSF